MEKISFIDAFNTAIEIDDITHIAVKIKQPKGSEVIIFDREMFESKLEYYKNAYDDDMKLKTFNEISIVNIVFSNDLAELAQDIFKSY